ncbi:MAG: hypothetical protein KGQ62_08330 [Gammaproteobacteria bacterium]|nr:hypothetical protein [Gammaproteobacteria bacterium]MDE2108991.1 hypothetical protein [Gammaproteobacteria bacterium]
MKIRKLYPALLLSAVALAGCNVNKNIDVPADAHWSSGTSTINGVITVGAGAVVDGGLRTINGAIRLGAGAQTGDLTIVNGGIALADGAHAGKLEGVNTAVTLGKNALIGADVAIVNGDLRSAPGTRIQGSAAVVNGDMALCGTVVSGHLSFVNGTVWLADSSSVQGDITAKQPKGSSGNNPPPVVVIGPHAIVGGSIIFERPGQLYVSDSAVIHAVQGATAVKFSGDAPSGVTLPKCPTD